MKKLFRNSNLVVIIFICLFTIPAFFITNSSNLKIDERDKFLQQEIRFKTYSPDLTPQKFCDAIRGADNKIPCTSSKSGLHKNITDKIRADVLSEIENATQSAKSLKDTVLSEKYSGNYVNQLSDILERRIESLNEIKRNLIEIKEQEVENRFLLRSLLLAQGYTYNEYSDQFKKVSYDIARYITKPDEIKKQLVTLNELAIYLPIISLAWLLIYFFIIKKKLNITGQFFYGFFSLIVTFGLVIIRDASLHYGIDSSLYHLNPFRIYLERQLLQTVVPGMIFFLIIILFGKKISYFGEIFLQLISIKYLAVIFIGLSFITYLLFGQALGAESIKISTCCLCAAILTKHGRILELAQDYFGTSPLIKKIFNLRNLSSILKIRSKDVINTASFFNIFIFYQIFLPILLLLTLIGMAALAFSDLGGSTVALIVLVFSTYILLGKKFATIFFILFSLATVLLIKFSDKVFGRFQLMLEPMRANVSDFARLIEFEKSGQPFGYGLNNIQWCSNSGVCIPLQSLSDYMPTIISAMIGEFLTFGFFSIFIVFLITLFYFCFIPSWYFNNKDRFASMFASLLCLATLSQLIITFLGNWRMIPLTGLGAPLISIGFSSMLAGFLGIGLALALIFAKND